MALPLFDVNHLISAPLQTGRWWLTSFVREGIHREASAAMKRLARIEFNGKAWRRCWKSFRDDEIIILWSDLRNFFFRVRGM